MKFLLKYRLFESLEHYKRIIQTLNNKLTPLGFSIQYSEGRSIDDPDNRFIAEFNPDISKYPNSVLYNIVKVVNPGYQMQDVCPVFNSEIGYHHTEDTIQFFSSANPNSKYNGSNINNIFFIKANENYYTDLVTKLIYIFEKSTGEINFNSTTYLPEGPCIESYPFIKDLILEYLNYLKDNQNFNIDKLYEITNKHLSNAPKVYDVFFNLKDTPIYNNIIKFKSTKDIKNSDNLKDKGYSD